MNYKVFREMCEQTHNRKKEQTSEIIKKIKKGFNDYSKVSYTQNTERQKTSGISR